MKKSAWFGIGLIAAIGTALGIFLYNLTNQETLVLIAAILATIGGCGAVMYFSSAEKLSNPKKLKTISDYRSALQAWRSEGTPFNDMIDIALSHLGSLERKQEALVSILDDSNEKTFLPISKEVEEYILANTKRLINRVMIYDGTDKSKFQTHISYLQSLVQQDAKLLSDFENLIVEVSQIGDITKEEMPCLKELTAALQSVRDDSDVWEHLDQQAAAEEPPAMNQQQMQ